MYRSFHTWYHTHAIWTPDNTDCHAKGNWIEMTDWFTIRVREKQISMAWKPLQFRDDQGNILVNYSSDWWDGHYKTNIADQKDSWWWMGRLVRLPFGRTYLLRAEAYVWKVEWTIPESCWRQTKICWCSDHLSLQLLYWLIHYIDLRELCESTTRNLVKRS